MTVLRIVPNIAAARVEEAKVFYRELLELDLVMDHGWILTFASDELAVPQLSVVREGGGGTEVPDISIEVDNVKEVYQRAKSLKLEIVYDLCDESWGVQRFFVKDPFDKVLNILSHL